MIIKFGSVAQSVACLPLNLMTRVRTPVWADKSFSFKRLLLLRAPPGIFEFAGTNEISAKFRCV